MKVKNIYFENFFLNSKKLKKNLKFNVEKTKTTINNLEKDIKSNKIPLIKVYSKNNSFNFTNADIKKYQKFKSIIIIGMGGSILGTKAIHSFLKHKINKTVYFLDNLDVSYHLDIRKISNLKNCLFIIVSKSGNTLETLANLGSLPNNAISKKNTIFIVEKTNNLLNNFAKKINAQIIQHKNYVGGRFSVLSEVGVLPSLLFGLKKNNLLNSLSSIFNKKIKNALIHSVSHILTYNSKNITNNVFLNYCSKLNDFCLWKQQLIGESLGKKGKGITPIFSSAPKDHHSLMQLYVDGPKDKFFTIFSSDDKLSYKISNEIISNKLNFIKNKKINEIILAQSLATKKVFLEKKIPFRTFHLKKQDEESLGILFSFFILETIILARAMDVNPFNQPAVEQIKVETKKFLNY